MSGALERRYRRVLRILPRWYRKQWEQDMVAAFLDSWLTGDPEADAYITQAAGPGGAEVASVAGLAARLYLAGITGLAGRLYRAGAGALRRDAAWGQAVRRAALAVISWHAVRGLAALVFLAWVRRWVVWLPRPPAGLVPASPPGIWTMGGYVVDYAWIVVFLTMVLRYYRTARIIAALIMTCDLTWLLRHEVAGTLLLPFGNWGYWVLLDLALVLAMAAFHQDAPQTARWPWLLTMPAGFLLVSMPLLALQVTGNGAWVPDPVGVCCILVSLACLAQAPRAWSRRSASSSVWSLSLMLLAMIAAALRIFSAGDYLHDPHLIAVSLAELLILAAAAALVAPDAARTRTAALAPQAHPHVMAT